jgi:MFS family permease
VAAATGGRYVARFGRSMVVLGLLICSVGLVALDLVVSVVDEPSGWVLLPALLMTGFGTGLVISPNVTLTVAEVDVRYAGSAGGMLQTVQRVGSAVGVALVLAQFFSTLTASRGDYAEAFSVGLRTTLGFVLAALLLGLLDLGAGRRASRRGGRGPEVAETR